MADRNGRKFRLGKRFGGFEFGVTLAASIRLSGLAVGFAGGGDESARLGKK